TKLVLAVRKRMGRDLTRDEAVRLASALRVRQMQQQRVYKPRMELWDDGESATITALFELPGLRANEVLLDVVDGRLVVQGERRPAPAVNTNRARVQASSGPSQIRELKYGTFRRVISIPAGCTTDDLEATLENGMLSVSWPR
ncbi:HSP20-like chaperone, partial [Lenzites betulinus]